MNDFWKLPAVSFRRRAGNSRKVEQGDFGGLEINLSLLSRDLAHKKTDVTAIATIIEYLDDR